MDYTKTELNHYKEEGEGSIISSETGSNDDVDQPSSIANELRLMELLKDNKAFELIYRHCQSNLPPHFQIVSILKNGFQTPLSQAKLKAFQIYIETVAKKNGGCVQGGGSKAAVEAARVKYGWCGVDEEKLEAILMYGFRNKNGFLYLSPDNVPLQCLINSSSSGDKYEIRFLLLSRIIMGKSEIVFPQGSTVQSYSSRPEFDSGVDSLTSLKKYVIWSTHMDTHVLPEFVVCIKAPSFFRKNPKYPWILFPVLIKLISRISGSELIQRLRSITGGRLLVHIIKFFGQKGPEGSRPRNLQ